MVHIRTTGLCLTASCSSWFFKVKRAKMSMALLLKSTSKKLYSCESLLETIPGTYNLMFFFVHTFRLATEQELLAAQAKAEEFEKENCDLVNTLTLKEQELDLRLQEKVN